MVKLNVDDSRIEETSTDQPRDKPKVKYLTSLEFILLSLSRHYVVENYAMMKYENMLETPTFFHILLTYIIIIIPVTYFETLIGQYTRRGIFNMRNIFILCKGMGYTYCLQMFSSCIIYVLLMSTYLVFAVAALGNTGKELEWLKCPENTSDTCFTAQYQCTKNGPCLTETRKLSSYIYLEEVYMREEMESTLIIAPLHKVEALFFCWFIIFLIMILSFDKIKSMITTLFTLVLIYRTLIFFTFLIQLNYWQYFKKVLIIDLGSMINFKAWNRGIRKTCIGLDLGKFSYILFGIYSSKTRKTGSLSWFCCMISFGMCFLDHIIHACAMMHISKLANLSPEQRYLIFNPPHALLEFGLMPIAFGKLGATFSALYFLHGACIIFFHVSLNYSFMQLSLNQQYPFIQTYELYLKPLFCLVGFSICILIDGRPEFAIRKEMVELVEEFCNQLNIIIFSITLFYIYGLAKFCDDVHFITSVPPTKFWRLVWMLTPFVAAVGLPFAIFTDNENSSAFIFRLFVIVFFYSPYLIFSIIDIIKHIRENTLINLFRATNEWGPEDIEERTRRSSFNPRRHLKRKNIAYVCAHQCLILHDIPDSDNEKN